MKKAKRFTAILLVAVLLGGCGSEDGTSGSKDRNKEPNDSKSEYIDSEEISERLEEVKDILGEKYSFDENNYILCQATNEKEKEEVSVNIYCDDKYGIGAACFNLAIPVIQSYCGSNFNIGITNGEDTLMYIVVFDVVISDEKPLFDETDENTMKLAEEFLQFLEDYLVNSGFSKDDIDKENGDSSENKEEQELENHKESENTSTITTGQRNALKSAKDYLSMMPFSHDGLIEQLKYEKYSDEDATYAADNCGADWNEQALKSAKNYLSMMAFSYTGLIQQLEHEQFTKGQATYAADNCGADWNEQAAKSAENYLGIMSFSKDGLIEQLEFEGFTHEQAVYGAEQNGF